MMTPRTWTLVVLTSLGATSTVHADGGDDPRAATADVLVLGAASTSTRGYAENYLVQTHGAELTGQMRFLLAEPVFAEQPVRFTDIALFDLSGRIGVGRHLELSGGVTLLPKQPSYTDEKPWQSVNAAVRTPLKRTVALALGVAGGHLMDHAGRWTQESLGVVWRKRVNSALHFDLGATADVLNLAAPHAPSATVGEVAANLQVVTRAPALWAGWIGLSYAVPVYESGMDPTTSMSTDAQPRLDARIGSTFAVNGGWDLFVEAAVIDRGDLSDPRTRLPILDGGFDQTQILFGISRHFTRAPDRSQYAYSAVE